MINPFGELGIRPVREKKVGTKSGTMMDSEPSGQRGSGTDSDPQGGSSAPRMTRRALLSGVSTGVAAGAVAWIAPEIFITKPAAGATLSVLPPGTEAGVVTPGPDALPTTPAKTTAATTAGTGSGVLSALASTGLDLQRDAEVGAALVAGGWAMQRWASRQAPAPQPAPEAPEAGSPDSAV